MIADIVREVAGPLAEVDGIIGEGVDPHVYKPTASDIKAMQSAMSSSTTVSSSRAR